MEAKVDRSEARKVIEERKRKISEVMREIRYKIGVISGKGGVGKSMVTANLAVALALKKYKVGIVDSDYHGPSIPKMLGVEDGKVYVTADKKLVPVEGPLGIKIMSIFFFLPDPTTAVVWRGPMKFHFMQEILSSTLFGELDFLLFDLPPGTGDEAINLVQSVPDLTGLIAVTQPTEVSALAVAKAIDFAIKANVRVLGVIENMSYFICPKCGSKYTILSGNGGEYLSRKYGVPLLGKIPIEPRIAESGDSGYSILIQDPKSKFSEIFMDIVNKILREIGE